MKFYDLINEREERNDIEFGGLPGGDITVKKASGLRGGTPAGEEEWQKIGKQNPEWKNVIIEVKNAINANKEAKSSFMKIDDNPDMPFRINAGTGDISLTDDTGKKWNYNIKSKKLTRAN